MKTNVTIKEIAKAANVSVTTVSMSLNNKDGVNCDTRKKVKKIAGELGYIPSFSARSLVTQKSNYIGLVIPEIINPFYSSIVDILSKIAERDGFTLLLGISNNKAALEKEYIEMFLAHRALGVVIVPILRAGPDTRHLELLRRSRTPFVFCTEQYSGASEPGVMCDFEQGEHDLITYLLDRRCREIAFVTVDNDARYASGRLKGFVRALEERGMAANSADIFLVDMTDFSSAYGVVDEIVKKHYDAIVTINDVMALGVMKRLSELNIKIPDDIWVAGFDDMMFAALAQTPITTVKQPLWEICGKCFDMLRKRIDAKDEDPRSESAESAECNESTVYLKAELVVRSTTA